MTFEASFMTAICRLPIIQGGTASFLTPALAILRLEKWQCPMAGTSLARKYNKPHSILILMQNLFGYVFKMIVMQRIFTIYKTNYNLNY